MSRKTLLVLIVGIIVSFTFVIVSILGLYRYMPILLSQKKASQDTLSIDTVYKEPLLAVTQNQLDDFQTKLMDKEKIRKQKDSLEKVRKNLLDSIQNFQKKFSRMMDSVNKVQKILGDSKNYSNKLKDSLNKIQSALSKSKEELKKNVEIVKKKESELNQKTDSNKVQNIAAFAKIYEKSSPAEVAKILEQLTENDAATILKSMTKKKAGKVLDAMKPEKAAALFKLGASK